MEIDRAKFEAVLERLDRPQAWVAKRLNVQRSTFHHYVTGRRRMPAALYPRLVAVLGTTDFTREEPAQKAAA